MKYAGIGRRTITPEIFNILSEYGKDRAIKGDTLRSGGALGADQAFFEGCQMGSGSFEIFHAHDATAEAWKIAQYFVVKWHSLEPYVQGLYARNVMILLGHNLKDPVSEVIYWVEEGGTCQGGTGMALRVATHFNIPCASAVVGPRTGSLNFYEI